jgi:hypothetical protein
MDHRLLNHDANFTSGGESVGRVISWVESRFGSDLNLFDRPRDVFILGDSAGADHIFTWLFDKRFSSMRETLINGANGVKLTGLVFEDRRFS